MDKYVLTSDGIDVKNKQQPDIKGMRFVVLLRRNRIPSALPAIRRRWRCRWRCLRRETCFARRRSYSNACVPTNRNINTEFWKQGSIPWNSSRRNEFTVVECHTSARQVISGMFVILLRVLLLRVYLKQLLAYRLLLLTTCDRYFFSYGVISFLINCFLYRLFQLWLKAYSQVCAILRLDR